MQTIKGTISKIKVLKLSNRPLVHFKVDDISCLIARHSFNFLYEAKENNQIVVCGQYNSKNQFVVKKYCVIDSPMLV
ncbi:MULTISPECIES: hypothetical protein [Tetragenococcus]|uniref:Uncharacterized protein n=1 Tax=Tetragenococcus osmophilus TaxID=526944 RepID=A0AA38CXX1_9ENTE|nr:MULTISPECIES: hypothetical protein [Tetragenococcus]AYW48453.1 hypothetical protein C7K38_08810 [Tetragenococcus osmophilus]GMA47301.1 hypothetical protein GCM10025854_15510 [Tetragenococcus muriaticus]GMA54320.1 hypothetical protein GCM10025857_56770 [Alicyclobacillus contaminans]GMA71815.1 hypothetical protein GCM10025885_08640 [Tetragenococcus osmophilus]